MAGTSGTQTGSPAPTAAGSLPATGRIAPAVRLGFRFILAGVFLMAAITKITDLHGFADLVLTRSGLPYWAGLITAAFLPWLELTCAACLLLGKAVREAALILAVLLTALLVYSLLHLNEPDCGCWVFPKMGSESLWWWPPARNFLLLLCSLRAAWRK
jgi:uncharacterized membrane protein YphA (DoxX/SURF4 family)